MGDAPQGVTRRGRARRIGRGVLQSRRGRVALCLVLILVISLVVLLLSRDPKDPVITLQAGQWDSAELHTGLAEYLIEHGKSMV